MEESFGAYLRKERELRFVELQEIADATMISLRFLEAIENDDFDDLPHPTFVKGFVRAYAKYIGLDQDEVITNYEHFIKPEEEEAIQEQLPQEIQLMDYNMVGIWGGVLVALLVVGIIIYSVFSADEQTLPAKVTPVTKNASTLISTPEKTDKVKPPAITKEPEAVGTTVEQKPVAPKQVAPKPVEQALQTKPKAEVQKPSPSSLPAEIPASPVRVGEDNGVVLQIKAREESYISYQLDDEEAKEVMFRKGRIKTLRAKDKIVLTVGNAAGVELWLNGKALPPIGKEGQVMRGMVFEAKPETEPESKPKPEVKPEPVFKPKPVLEPKPEPEPEIKSEPAPKPVPVFKPKPVLEPKPEPETKPEPEPKPEVEIKLEPVQKPEAETEAE